MTIVFLALVSLFALVVTSRPILPSNADSVPTSSALQTGVQAPFRINPGKDDLTSDAAHLHFQKPNQQIGYLSELDRENDEAIASFQISSEKAFVFEALADETTPASDALNDHNDTRADDVTDNPGVSVPLAVEQHEAPTDDSPSTLLVVLAFSCVTALLALVCVTLSLHIIKSLRSQVLTSRTIWELLPHSWKRPCSQENTSAAAEQHLSGEGCLLPQMEVGWRSLPDTGQQKLAQRTELHLADKPLYFDAASDIESEWNDAEEKYQDALDMTPLPLIHDLPLKDNVSCPSHLDDPSLPPVGSDPLGLPTTDGSTPLMRELCLSPSPVSRPAWSVRAMDSPALGVSSRHGGVDATPQLLFHPRRRAYRSPIPGFDIALAMQLRPGLGIGADPAWMVRFLMAIFGWFAIALTGNSR